MSDMFRCREKESLVAYLYGEIDAEARREIERHLEACRACADEIEGLQGVRRELESWLPPEPELGFTIVQKPPPATVLRPSRWSLARLPAWAKVAAAVLAIGSGAALANVQVRYGNDGLFVTTGWMRVPTVAQPATAIAPSEEWRPALIALEQRLQSDLAQMKRTGAVSEPRGRRAEAIDSEAVLRRVRAWIDESERRQRQEMALRLTQADRDWNIKRNTDLMRITQNLGRLEGSTIATRANQQEVMNLLRRVSAQPIP